MSKQLNEATVNNESPVMKLETEDTRRVFTVEQANRMLPLVRAIVRDLVILSREVIERHQRVEHLKAGRDMESGDPYDDELAQIEADMGKERKRLHEFIQELQQLGVEPKSGVDGLVDFPAVLDGHLVYLCWRYDEPEIQYWHEIDAGYANRRPLTVDAVDDCPSCNSC